ncbi:MAG: RsmB/NOP family class I SAM-dependent RNA methyltransferase [Rhodobacteraceae bacterium]|jgi:16S rRNA (cytosine967-C5)-methyltransferase|nr:RsmB/NOP family class I SAM-dependent RNA methyltransferase [Paracoccaceae bacterium]
MTPGARLAAAIGILDAHRGGAAAEAALTRWGRTSRHAGAGDRLAVRDLVYAALRCQRSHAALGGAGTGRGLILGGLVEAGADPAALFTGEGHAPAPLTAAERAHLAAGPALADLPEAVALDCPDWLVPPLRDSLGGDFAPVMRILRRRAPVFLRVNLRKGDRAGAVAALAAEGIAAGAHPLAAEALEVVAGARRVQRSAAYRSGLVELQDASSQAVAAELPLRPGARVLDLCAGGGGKTLALAAREPGARYFAHDAAPARMRDLAARAARAGAQVTRLGEGGPEVAGPFELVLADVPCSGTGAWRRQPEAKWTLTPARLAALAVTQAAILDRAARLVAPGGLLAYATCSLLAAENRAAVDAFLDRSRGWNLMRERHLSPLAGGDGFFLALLTRETRPI